MKKIFYSVAVSLVVVSCYNLDHTQNSAPDLATDVDAISANGISQAVITAKTKNEFSAIQPLVFTSSNGLLFETPLTSSSVGANTLVLHPVSNSVKVILRSSLAPDDNVIVTASINEMISSKKLQFTRSCPNEAQITISKDAFSIGNEDEGQITISLLRNDQTMVSQNIRINLSLSDPTIANVPLTLFSDANGSATGIIKPLMKGSATLSITVQNCANVTIAPSLVNINVID